MKRHPALQDLSRDHFTALNHVVQVRRVIDKDRFAKPLAQVHEPFAALARGELMDHFDEEEALLLPLVDARPPLAALGDRLRDDHARLRSKAETMADAPDDLEGLWDFAQDLERHARWEEDQLFEELQSALSEAELLALQGAQDAFRRDRGMPVGPG